MLVLGVILVLVAAGAVFAAVAGSSTDPATFDLGSFTVEMSPLGVFLSGAASVLLLVLGLGLMRAGMRSANKRRKEKKELNRLAQKLEAKESGSNTATTTGGSAAEPTTRPSDGGVTGTDRPGQ